MSKSTAWIKKSLTLPKSTFPPRPPKISSERSQQLLKSCTEDLYAWQQVNRRNAPTFTLHDGPPYANGDLHIGHALNKILKDITCRFQLSQGKRVAFVPGWDCHGLPIELKALEKEANQKSQAASEGASDGTIERDTGKGIAAKALRIRRLARSLASSTVEKQQKQFQQWGIMADWKNRWTTMDKEFEIEQLEVFKKMVGRDLIYRQFKPVYWSPSTRTALAEAELEYRDDHVSTAAYVKYPIVELSDGIKKKLGGLQDVSCVIWTTMPWTLPANRAIGFNAQIEYTILKTKTHGHLLVSRARAEDVAICCGEEVDEAVTISGSELHDVKYGDTTWTQERVIRPLLSADHVTADAGTGLAHLAPGHGPDDYRLCLKNGISPFAPVSEDGCFDNLACPKEPGLLVGKEVMSSGNDVVLQHLDGLGLIIKQHSYRHKYPYDWRSKKPVILRATAQWFANVGQLQEKAMQALESTVFVPSIGQNRLNAFVRNRSEWCISRQRAWGVPIPALYHRESGEALMTVQSVEHVISVIEARGTDAWWSTAEDDPEWTPPSQRNADGTALYRRGLDTMDVWFDSGTSWTQTTDTRGHPIQADMYLEGSDQHRGWFQSSLLTYIADQESPAEDSSPSAPFQSLVTHGFVLDQKGRKMSKSEGNVISPSQVMDGSLLPVLRKKLNGKSVEIPDEMGPDALRLWVASCDFTRDVSLSVDQLKNVNGALSKLRVTFKQLLGLLNDKLDEPAADERPSELALHHRIALFQVQKMQDLVHNRYEALEYHKGVEELNRYVNVDLSALWLEAIKDDAYCGGVAARLEVQTVVRFILRVLTRIIEPLTPSLIEEVWMNAPTHIDHLRLREAARQSPAPSAIGDDLLSKQGNSQLEEDLPHLLAIKDAIHACQERAKLDKKMGPSLECSIRIEHPDILAPSDILKDGQSWVAQFFARYPATDLARLVSLSDLETSSEYHNPTTNKWHYAIELKLGDFDLRLAVVNPRFEKCVRCWRYVTDPEDQQPEAVLPTNHSSPDNYPLQDMVLVLKDPRYTALLKPHKALTLKNIEQKQQIKELQNQISHTTNHLTLKRSELSLYHQYMELLQQRLDAANDQLSHAHAQLTSANTLNADNLRMLGYYQNQCNSQRQALQDAEQRNLQQMREIVSLQQKLGSAWPPPELLGLPVTGLPASLGTYDVKTPAEPFGISRLLLPDLTAPAVNDSNILSPTITLRGGDNPTQAALLISNTTKLNPQTQSFTPSKDPSTYTIPDPTLFVRPTSRAVSISPPKMVAPEKQDKLAKPEPSPPTTPQGSPGPRAETFTENLVATNQHITESSTNSSPSLPMSFIESYIQTWTPKTPMVTTKEVSKVEESPGAETRKWLDQFLKTPEKKVNISKVDDDMVMQSGRLIDVSSDDSPSVRYDHLMDDVVLESTKLDLQNTNGDNPRTHVLEGTFTGATGRQKDLIKAAAPIAAACEPAAMLVSTLPTSIPSSSKENLPPLIHIVPASSTGHGTKPKSLQLIHPLPPKPEKVVTELDIARPIVRLPPTNSPTPRLPAFLTKKIKVALSPTRDPANEYSFNQTPKPTTDNSNAEMPAPARKKPTKLALDQSNKPAGPSKDYNALMAAFKAKYNGPKKRAKPVAASDTSSSKAESQLDEEDQASNDPVEESKMKAGDDACGGMGWGEGHQIATDRNSSAASTSVDDIQKAKFTPETRPKSLDLWDEPVNDTMTDAERPKTPQIQWAKRAGKAPTKSTEQSSPISLEEGEIRETDPSTPVSNGELTIEVPNLATYDGSPSSLEEGEIQEDDTKEASVVTETVCRASEMEPRSKWKPIALIIRGTHKTAQNGASVRKVGKGFKKLHGKDELPPAILEYDDPSLVGSPPVVREDAKVRVDARSPNHTLPTQRPFTTEFKATKASNRSPRWVGFEKMATLRYDSEGEKLWMWQYLLIRQIVHGDEAIRLDKAHKAASQSGRSRAAHAERDLLFQRWRFNQISEAEYDQTYYSIMDEFYPFVGMQALGAGLDEDCEKLLSKPGRWLMQKFEQSDGRGNIGFICQEYEHTRKGFYAKDCLEQMWKGIKTSHGLKWVLGKNPVGGHEYFMPLSVRADKNIQQGYYDDNHYEDSYWTDDGKTSGRERWPPSPHRSWQDPKWGDIHTRGFSDE